MLSEGFRAEHAEFFRVSSLLILTPFCEKTMHNLTGYATPLTTAARFLLSVFELSAKLF